MKAVELAEVLRLVRGMAERVVDNVGALQVYLRPDGVTIQVVVAERDLGRIIGKEGRVARSIRIIVDGMAKKGNTRLWVDVATGSKSS